MLHLHCICDVLHAVTIVFKGYSTVTLDSNVVLERTKSGDHANVLYYGDKCQSDLTLWRQGVFVTLLPPTSLSYTPNCSFSMYQRIEHRMYTPLGNVKAKESAIPKFGPIRIQIKNEKLGHSDLQLRDNLNAVSNRTLFAHRQYQHDMNIIRNILSISSP